MVVRGEMLVEPITTTLSALASLLSIANSVLKLMKKGVSREDALTMYRDEATPQEREIIDDPENRAAILEVTVISRDLLEQLAKEAKACERKLIAARRRAEEKGRQIDKTEADRRAAQCMCNVLRDIMLYNEKELPEHGPFKRWWRSYGCTA